MKRITTVAVVAVLAATMAGTARAESRAEKLRAAQEQLARRADTTKGGPRQLLLMEQRRLDKLIGDLERGESVDPAEIDRALQRAEHGAP